MEEGEGWKMKTRIFHPITNEKFEAVKTDELDNELAEIRKSFECSHSNRELIKAKIKNGNFQIKLACLNCGESLGNPLKREAEHESLPEHDLDEIRSNYYMERFELEKEKIIYHSKKQNNYQSNWWREYKIYLNSKEWKEKRSLKLKEKNFQCEGCGKDEATEVHHISYENVPYEMLFELRALCSFCHDMMHLDKEGRKKIWTRDLVRELPCDGCRYQSEEFGRRWCIVHDRPATVSIASENYCGPTRKSFEGLK